jgi:hypothetical protein
MSFSFFAAKMHKASGGTAHLFGGYSRALITSASNLDFCASLRPIGLLTVGGIS